MLDLISRGAQGHGPVHLLLTSADVVGFAWDGDERGRVRSSLPPLEMMTVGLLNTFILLSWMLGGFVFLLSWLREMVSGELSLLTFKALYNYLSLPT